MTNRARFLLPVLALLAGGGASAESAAAGPAEIYAGVFAGAARMDGRIVDVEGFSNWGNPGWSVDHDDAGIVGGDLAGKRLDVGGLGLRIEIDAMLGGMSAATNQLDPHPVDPVGPDGVAFDETATSEFRWVATARVGIERSLGPATAFVAAGLAAARIDDSVSDLDRGVDPATRLPTPFRPDPDDSFREGATRLGWTAGLGVETPLADGWTLRLEGSWMDFGRSTHHVNHSGGNRCYPDGPRRPCRYDVEHGLGVARLAVVRRFSL